MTPSFRCAAVGCYSYESLDTHKLFKELQSYLNRFSRVVGFALLATDGILGAGTLAAAQKTALAMSRSGASVQVKAMATPFVGIATSELLARNAPAYLAFLKAAAGEANLPAVSAPKPGSSGTTAIDVTTLPGFPKERKLNKAYVAAGAIFGVAVLIGGYQLMKGRL
jgi:lysozyme family protein